jgi:cytoskeleton protein RodZ
MEAVMSESSLQGVGQILAQARQAKGMSVADVAGKLKLTERQVEAIEADDHSRLPSPVFVRGFVRNYARLVEVPVESLPGAVEQASPPTETITAPSEEVVISTSPIRRWLLFPLVGLLLFLALVALLYNWLRQGEEAYLPTASTQSATQARPVILPMQAPVKSDAPVPATPAAPPQPGNAATAGPAPAVTVSSPAQPAVALPPAQGANGQTVPTPAPQSNATMPSPGPATSAPGHLEGGTNFEFGDATPGSHVVSVSALAEESWVSVDASDGRRYSQLLPPGGRMTVHGVPPLRVVLGNGAHASLTYDGKPIELQPHIGNRVARLTLK